MSSDTQDTSPDQQRAEIAKLAEKHGCQVLREYCDLGISGDDARKRKEFQRMICDVSEKRDFATILCWDQDRFGRFDSIEAGHWIHPLREQGVRLITVAQGQIDWNDFTGRMMYAIQQEGKHQFLIDLSRNVLRGKLASARKGQGASMPPYGLDRGFYDEAGCLVQRVPYGTKMAKPKGWSVRFLVSKDEHATNLVRWLFETFAESDCGMGWLAADLNRRGVLTAAGKAWSIQTVRGMLTNRVYTGDHIFGRKRYGKYHHTSDDGSVARGPGCMDSGQPIVVAGVHEPLIDRELFERVQAKLVDRASTGRRSRSSDYLLSGILRCGHCGGPMAGKGYKKGDVPSYYICVNGATRPGTCKRYQVQKKPLEEYVLRFVEARLFQPDAIKAIEQAIAKQAKGRPSSKGQAAQLEEQVAALTRKISKGNENLLLADPVNVPGMSRMLRQWEDDLAKLQAKLENVMATPMSRTPEEAVRRAMGELGQLRKHFEAGDLMRRRGVLRAIVDDIRLWWQPYGKRNRRFAQGTITLKSDLPLLSSGSHAR
jgi:hypothetical protein